MKGPLCVVLRVSGLRGSPDDSWGDFSTKEYAECADRVGGEHADDGEGDGEILIQRTRVFCRQSGKM